MNALETAKAALRQIQHATEARAVSRSAIRGLASTALAALDTAPTPQPDDERMRVFTKAMSHYTETAHAYHQGLWSSMPAMEQAHAAVLALYAQALQSQADAVKVPDAIKYCGDNERDRYTADGFNWCRAEVLRLNARGAK